MYPLRKLLPGKRGSDEPLISAAPSKKRSTLACEICRQKKTKCDGVRPTCGACDKRASACHYSETKSRQMQEVYEGLPKQRYACGNFLRLLRSGTEEHAVGAIRRLRAGADVETILLDESFNCTSANSELAYDALHLPSQDFVIACEEHKYSVVSSGSLATQGKRDNQLGKEAVLQEIVDHLRGMPENAAERLLGELRSTTNTTSVLRLIRGTMLRKSLSEQSTARSLLPALHSQMELELMVRYPKAYPALDQSQDSGLLQGLSGGMMDTGEHSPWKSDPIHTWESYEQPLPKTLHSLPPADLPAKPHTIASDVNEVLYFSSSLSQLNIGFWTNVEVTNHVAASAISLYLETDHPMCGFFNANLFIRDLVQLNLEHCSAFLVSSLLAFACTIYAAKDAQGSDLSQRFQQEAAALWEVERKADTLPALAGLGLLFLATLSHGKDSGALEYLDDFADMARRLKLFDVTDRLTTADIASLPQETQMATAQAAWATYNHLCMQSVLHWRTPVRIPPALPIPGANLNGEVDVQVDSIFTAHCYFWVMASDTISVFRNFKASVAFAYARYHKLLAWTNLLSGIMIRGTHNEAHVLVFHMFLHAIIMDIFRPFVQEEKQHGFRTWQTNYNSPEVIFATSLKQLKSLVLCIKKQSSLTAMWHVALLYVANAALKDTKDPEWRFYFLTCIENYQKMYCSFPVMSMAVQGLLTLALRRKAITTGEARDLMYKVPARPREPNDAQFVLDMDLVLKTSEGAKVNNIARDFDDLVLFEEFIEHTG